MTDSGVEYRANPRFHVDNVSIKFGSDGDSRLYYDGTDLVISPAVVGTGDLKVSGAGLLLDSGEMIDFGVGDVMLTHAASKLSVTGGDLHIGNGDGVVIGHTAQVAVGGQTPEFQILGNGWADSRWMAGIWKADSIGARGYFHKSRNAGIGSQTVVQDGDEVGSLVFTADDGVDNMSEVARIGVFIDGTPGADDTPGRILFSTTADGASGTTERMRIDSTGQVFIGDTANASMTVGLTVNQGANDDEAFALKSSDVNHTLTAEGETDTYFSIKKRSGVQGGATITVLQETTGSDQVLAFHAHGGTANTSKTTTASGLVNFDVTQISGGTYDNIGADGNVFSVKARIGGSTLTRFLIDEDGDLYTVTAAQTFDDYDDVALIEAYDHVRSGDAAYEIKSEFGKFAVANEAALIEAGVLGGTIAEGGLTNQTQLIRVLTGAARQQAERIRQLESTVAGLLPAGG